MLPRPYILITTIMPKGLPEVPDDIEEILAAIPEGPAVKDVSQLTHELTLWVLTKMMDRDICPVRAKNRQVSPMQLAGEMLRRAEEVLNK